MATTFSEEYQKALGERGLALTSKRTAVQMNIDANQRREDLEQILFGDGINYGIVSVMVSIYDQIKIMTGRTSSKPVLHNLNQAKSQYQTRFALSVTPEGDGTGGFHPPILENPDAGQDDVDPNSEWLTDHALEDLSSASGTGVIQLMKTLADVIGKVATDNANARGPYLDEAAAQTNRASTRGSGILGLRTENSEIYSSGSAPNIQWRIGQNGIDTPDNYTTKSNLISALANVKNELVVSLIPALEHEYDLLEGAGGDILQEFKVDLPNDPDLLNLVQQIQEFGNTLQDYIDFFDQFTNPSSAVNRSEINTKLSEVLSYCDTIATALNDRVTNIIPLLGDASSGTRKHLVFWVSEIVMKPDGPYAMILAADDMFEQAQINLIDKNNRLNFFSTNLNEWIETTSIQALYDRAVLNLDKETIKRWETDIIWNLVLSANKYKVISKTFNELSLPLTNDPWDESSGVWITEKMPSTFLKNQLTLNPPSETTIFRLIAYDTSQGDSGDFGRMDAFDTSSLQSDIISDYIVFTQVDNTEADQSVIEADAEVGLKERDFLWINGSEIAQVIAVTDNQYALDTDYGEITHIQRIFGIYYKEPQSLEN